MQTELKQAKANKTRKSKTKTKAETFNSLKKDKKPVFELKQIVAL